MEHVVLWGAGIVSGVTLFVSHRVGRSPVSALTTPAPLYSALTQPRPRASAAPRVRVSTRALCFYTVSEPYADDITTAEWQVWSKSI